MKNNQYSQINYWAHMLDEAMDENRIPVISSIGEFLDLCKEKGEEVNKAKVKKQGKVVNATLADKDNKIKSREGTETAHKGDLVVDDGDDTFYAVNSKDISKYYELDKDGKSVTGDQTKWKKIAKELEYYVTPFDVDIKVQWQEKPLHATKGYALVCNDKDGKDISPVAPDVFNDKTLWLKESKTMKKPTIESFTYNPTENIFEDDGETVLKVICVYSADFEQDTSYCRGVASREGDEFVDSQIEAETEKSETFKFPVYLNVNVPDEIGLDDFESVRDKIEEYAIDAFNETNDFKFVKAVSLEFDDATDDVFAESEDKQQTNKNICDEGDEIENQNMSFDEVLDNFMLEKYGLDFSGGKSMSGHVIVRSYRIYGTDEENEEILEQIQREPFIRDNNVTAYIANISGRNTGPSIQLMFDESKLMNESDESDDFYEGDFPAWALDYVVNGEIGSVSRSEKQMIDGWFATLQEQGYDTTMISYGEDEYFSSRPEFGLACDCVSVKVYKAQSR